MNNYKSFTNYACEFYPCHKIKQINCLFCYCPLYFFVECGGEYNLIEIDDDMTIKDCSKCTEVHKEGGYDVIQERLKYLINYNIF